MDHEEAFLREHFIHQGKGVYAPKPNRFMRMAERDHPERVHAWKPGPHDLLCGPVPTNGAVRADGPLSCGVCIYLVGKYHLIDMDARAS